MSPGRVMLLLAHAPGVVFMASSAALLFRHVVAAPGRVNQNRTLSAVCVYAGMMLTIESERMAPAGPDPGVHAVAPTTPSAERE